jgi:hypothetical protein
MNSSLSDLQRAAYQADDTYRSELSRVYGRRASDARYYPHHTDPRVQHAAEAKIAADRAYLEALRLRNQP